MRCCPGRGAERLAYFGSVPAARSSTIAQPQQTTVSRRASSIEEKSSATVFATEGAFRGE